MASVEESVNQVVQTALSAAAPAPAVPPSKTDLGAQAHPERKGRRAKITAARPHSILTENLAGTALGG